MRRTFVNVEKHQAKANRKIFFVKNLWATHTN